MVFAGLTPIPQIFFSISRSHWYHIPFWTQEMMPQEDRGGPRQHGRSSRSWHPTLRGGRRVEARWRQGYLWDMWDTIN